MILLPLAVLLAKQVWELAEGKWRGHRWSVVGGRHAASGKWKMESFARLPIRTGRRENGMHQLRL